MLYLRSPRYSVSHSGKNTDFIISCIGICFAVASLGQARRFRSDPSPALSYYHGMDSTVETMRWNVISKTSQLASGVPYI